MAGLFRMWSAFLAWRQARQGARPTPDVLGWLPGLHTADVAPLDRAEAEIVRLRAGWREADQKHAELVRLLLWLHAEAKHENDVRDEFIGEMCELLAAIWLYVDWRYVTRQLTTDQKTIWADAIDTTGDLHELGPRAERWWTT